MPREWTEEQREEARQRAKEHGFGRKGQAAQVDVQEVPPVGASPEVFLAENEGRVEKNVSSDVGEDGTPVKTTHTGPSAIIMYKPSGSGYSPRRVSVSSLRVLIKNGWREFCPDCNAHHLDKDGEDSTDPNLCKARDPVAVRICRVCGKRIYDNMQFPEHEEGAEDPNVLTDESYEVSTPQSRTQAALNLHYWVRHPRSAQIMNVPPLPAAMRDLVEEAKVS